MAGRPPLRLYRDDSHLTRFGARVTAAAPAGEGLLSLELDRTAFYPTGGGQPHDTGRLADLEVVDVREAQDGRILHLVKAGPASPSPGDDVEAEIDWLRRFDHMQQHTGQHILSRAFLDAAAASTRSFHLGESACTIDLDLPAATERTIRQAESIANQVIFDDRPVAVRLLDPAQAPRPAAGAGPEREPVLRPGDAIRLIGVKDFDETPCGGTHVRSSGAVGSVAIRGWERFKGGTRVTFLCGGRVVAAFRSLASAADACAARLSAHPYELDAAAARLLEHLAEARRGLRTLSERLAQTEAAELRREAREAAGLRVVVRDLGERPAEELQRLAQACAA
ncbi:MAG TPA: alanyl-tRNA editing protein, partial [Candidatus Polarisedimenticolia bacterium]|nr:alanyl-tRNA editing protein [Candidatus Polarisedimenticolia bacterium]